MLAWKARVVFALCTCLLLSACIIRIRQVKVEPLSGSEIGRHLSTPVKAHLLDGSTVVYLNGVSVGADTLRGEGTRYDLRLREAGSVTNLPLDSVAGMENYRTGTNLPASLALSLPATAITVAGSLAIFKALFGSCPTFYADSSGTMMLQAEGFSYSIAPLFEVRDVDRLRVRPNSAGEVRLEVRNEALETHYLNQLELLEVRHRGDELVLPDPGGAPLALQELLAPASAVDRLGRNMRAVLADADGLVYETMPELLDAARADDMRDHLDLVFPAPRGADSAALVLRLRNSLLTTILLYDVMLGAQGAQALEWLGAELGQVGSVLELGQWYNRHMGLRVYVWEDGGYRQVGRVGDTGPIAWKDVAVVVPVPAGDSLRVRLSFVTDGWRIDHVALATRVRRPAVRTIPATRVTNAEGNEEPMALHHLQVPDERYLQTTPGQRFTVHFETGDPDAREAHTYLLASQGYYTEWIRPSWIRAAPSPAPFRPSDDMLLTAIERWRSQRESFEEQFYNTRIPVR
jgi:hypothetical protein